MRMMFMLEEKMLYKGSFYLEDHTNNTTTNNNNSNTGSSSYSSRGRPACSKQTINAGDNPCPSFQSPLPYMLAGLAAMVLLVVISLMILACSYLRGYFSGEESRNSSMSSSAGGVDPENPKSATFQASHNGFGASPEKIVVILAGQDKPTHLAQPVRVSNEEKQSVSSTAQPSLEMVVHAPT